MARGSFEPITLAGALIAFGSSRPRFEGIGNLPVRDCPATLFNMTHTPKLLRGKPNLLSQGRTSSGRNHRSLHTIGRETIFTHTPFPLPSCGILAIHDRRVADVRSVQAFVAKLAATLKSALAATSPPQPQFQSFSVSARGADLMHSASAQLHSHQAKRRSAMHVVAEDLQSSARGVRSEQPANFLQVQGLHVALAKGVFSKVNMREIHKRASFVAISPQGGQAFPGILAASE